MSIYIDSSFLLSLYLIDRHAVEASKRMVSQAPIRITSFHRCEFACGVEQHVFRGSITAAQGQATFRNFELDCSSGVWALSAFPANAFESCTELARHYTAKLGARTLDALHVASALELGAQSFWTFDERQKRLAEAAGLQTS